MSERHSQPCSGHPGPGPLSPEQSSIPGSVPRDVSAGSSGSGTQRRGGQGWPSAAISRPMVLRLRQGLATWAPERPVGPVCPPWPFVSDEFRYLAWVSQLITEKVNVTGKRKEVADA